MTRKELDHTAMEADKSQDVPLARRVDDVVQSKCWQNWDPEKDVSVQFRRQERICVLALSSHSGGISSSVQLLHCVWLFVTPCTAAHQASLSTTNSQSLLKFMSIESVMPAKHLILCHPLLLLSSVFPSISVFSSDSVLRIRRPKYWSFSFSNSTSNEYSGLVSFRMSCILA